MMYAANIRSADFARQPIYTFSPMGENVSAPAAAPVLAQQIYRAAALVGGAASLYHGYRRNRSVLWALVWGAFGSAMPFISLPLALAQGFGQPKAGRATANRRLSARKMLARSHRAAMKKPSKAALLDAHRRFFQYGEPQKTRGIVRAKRLTPNMKCVACRGPAHPATGHQIDANRIFCGPCTREFFAWLRSHQARDLFRVGPDKPDEFVSFYEHVGALGEGRVWRRRKK